MSNTTRTALSSEQHSVTYMAIEWILSVFPCDSFDCVSAYALNTSSSRQMALTLDLGCLSGGNETEQW